MSDIQKYNLVSAIENTKDIHKIAVMLKCDYPFINQELNKRSIKTLQQLLRSKKYD
jgi:molybdopterin-guanine dinucleotide biosynthesis protein A